MHSAFVREIINGNVFVTVKNDRIRLDGVKINGMSELCEMATKKKLECLILDQKVKYEVIDRDEYGIIIANVWLDECSVNDEMALFISLLN